MAFEIYRTTAEHVIGCVDATLQSLNGADEELVATFLDSTEDYASNALKMAEELDLVETDANSLYQISSPCSAYLSTSKREQKAAILRFVLEQFEPFIIFRNRLDITSGVAAEAATQTLAVCGMNTHRDIVAGTLVDLGTYSNALKSQGAGLYIPNEVESINYLKILDNVLEDRQSVELYLVRRLGEEAIAFIDRENVLNNLINAYLRLENIEEDTRPPIVHAGNAIESFLTHLGQHQGVDMQNATGINSKIDTIYREGSLNRKHKNIGKYIGHIRNAADHGIDQDIGDQWAIRETTAIEYVNVSLTFIKDIVDFSNQNYFV